ncbi:citron rho-interacting kinase-like [Portunus trituberculatus]|uniref:citron rho-interacting kinase-like n=1 Tax=Portunus trituberculatus TaxID=210409 RepID=UPI001E1D1C5E|nr:citron rho-interacting kinase-like [Portunus trituberculatus]
MEEARLEPIIKRIRQLRSLVCSAGLEAGQHGVLAGQEGLLDALLVLYEECNKDYLKKEEAVTSFVNKYRNTIHEVRNLRVNLNDFEQKKVIGKGKFGVVQVVREKATGNVYALKILRKSDTLSQKHVTFYEEERDILAKATSAWMTHLHYAFQDAQQLYLVMDFHPGGDLLSLLDRYDGSFSEDMACFYLAEVTLAVHDLHSMGYVHRDIKPENILIDRCGHLKLADFGSAARLTSSGVVRSKMPVGTPDYIAPEVLQSLDGEINVSYGTECDMWSLGIVMYEMLYGNTPFKADQVVATYSNIMNHHETLKFDDKEKVVSETAKQLMRGLLEEASHRLTHSGLLQHKFFLHINWNDLRNTAPPFVPIVNGLDDTSNFEEFENERRMPSMDAFRVPQTFTGKNLPFVGFTYSRQNPDTEKTIHTSSTTAINISILDESLREPSQLEAQLKMQKKENHQLKLQLQAMKDGEGERHLKLKDYKLKEAEMRLEYLEKERQRLEEENTKKEREAANYKKDLANERADRTKTEREVIDLIKDMKKKWKADAAKKTEEYNVKINAYEGEVAYLKAQHQEVGNALLEREKEFQAVVLKNKELKKTIANMEKTRLSQRKVEQCSGGCDAAKALQLELTEISSRLDEQKSINDEAESRLLEAINETRNLERTLLDRTREEDEKRELQRHIDHLTIKAAHLEEELEASTKKFQNLKEQEHQEKKKQIDYLKNQVDREKEECSRLRQQLQNVSCQLNESIASLSSLGSTRSLKEEEQEAKIKELEQELKVVTGDKVNLQSQLMVVKAKEGEHKAKISELELLLAKLDETVNQLEGKKHSTEACEDMYKARLECLETQLDGARSALAQEKEKVKKLTEDLKQFKQELSDCKLDLRVAEREAKSTQDTIAFLREKSREQRSQLAEKEAAIKKASEVEVDYQKVIDKLEGEIKSREADIEKQKLEHQHACSKLEEKIKSLQEVKKSGEQHQRKLQEVHQQMDSLKLEKRGLESQIKMDEAAKGRVEQEKSSLKQEIAELQKKLQQSELTISQLKQVCTDQDEELSQMEAQADVIKQLSQEEARLNQELEKLQGDIRAARASANEEKSLKLFQEKKVKELEKQLREADAETDQQIVQINEQLKEVEEGKEALRQQNDAVDQELNEAMTLLKNLERKLIEVKSQRDLAQQECAGHIEHIHTLKESNFKLTEGLEEAISKAELYKARIEEVEGTLADQRALQEDTRVKMQCTINQQTKLIDFLQSKMDNKKKKNLKDKLFGKENKENVGFSMPHQYRELEDMLAQERSTKKRLEEELAKARAALKGNSMDSRDTPRASRTPLLPRTPMPPPSPRLPQTPQNKRPAPIGGEKTPTPHHSSSRQRMRHSIPHRWLTGLQMHGGRCAGCLGSIPFARSAAKCQECGKTAHIKCSQKLPPTCGLPVQFAQHLSKDRTPNSPEKGPSSSNNPHCVMEGWLKMPRSEKSCWDSCYISLEKDAVLVYDSEPSSTTQPRARVSLNRVGCSTTVMSTVPRSELPTTSSVDLPYILKVEIRAKTAGGSSDMLYLMTTNFEEKQNWVTALESVVAQLSKGEGSGGADEEYIQADCLLTLDQPSTLDVNTIVFLGQATAVIGAAEGLFSFIVDDAGNLKSRSRIEGLTNVHQILLVPSAGVALFIAGMDNLVYQIDVGSLTTSAEAMQLTKPSISPVRVEPLQGCHLLASGTTKARQTFMCAAASDRICILVWKDLEERFSLCNQYSTQEPCSCLHFTQVSLIVGAEKFYEIDLKTFEIEEFLDESDTSLTYAIYGSAQMSSFPVAIIQVSKPGKHGEYLLCFHEFAVFVDPYGQRSREHDIRFTRLPIAIEYRSPFLYIIHQNAIEVVEICADSFTKSSPDSDSDSDASPPVRMASRNMPRPLFIGSATTPEGIMVTCKASDKLEVTQVQASFPEDMELNSTWGTLPSYSLKLDDKDTASIASSSSIGSPDMEPSNKRVHFKHNSRTSNKVSKSEM